MSVNISLQDAAIAHRVNLERYSNGAVYRIIAVLNKADAELFTLLTNALDQLPEGSFTVERLEQLLLSVRELNLQAYTQVEKELTADLKALTAHEAGYQADLFASTFPARVLAQVSIARVDIEQAYSAALARPFQGRLLKEWAQSLEAGRMVRIRDAIRMGYVQGEPISAIVRRVRGTKAKGFSDGIIEIDRRHAEAVVRTAISHTAAVTRTRFHDDNGDLIKAVRWLSTLDTRTTEICMLRDGKEYTPDTHKPIGHSLPWLGGPGQAHWGCRSVDTPITKSLREMGIDLDSFTPSDRASMDGTVPNETTYGEWLARQGKDRQIEVLGATRAKLLRDGGLPLERFANDKGKFYTLDELKKHDAKAFTRAGL